MKYAYMENAVESYLVNEIEHIGGLCYKFTSPSLNGVPDRIVFYKGQVLFVECKAPNEKPRSEQILVHKAMSRHGIPVYVLSTIEQIDEFIYELAVFNRLVHPEKYLFVDDRPAKTFALSAL